MPTKVEVKWDQPEGFPDDWGVWRIFRDDERLLSFDNELDARRFAALMNITLVNVPTQVRSNVGTPTGMRD